VRGGHPRTALGGALGVWRVRLAGASAALRRPGSAINAPSCAVRTLRLSLTKPISPRTDERGREFALRNTSDHPCILSVSAGRIVLYDHARRMPFVYDFDIPRGGELEVPPRRLRPALLLPSTAGYFSATKQECVGRASGVATEMRVILPGKRPRGHRRKRQRHSGRQEPHRRQQLGRIQPRMGSGWRQVGLRIRSSRPRQHRARQQGSRTVERRRQHRRYL
jgi:hypothetical protein